MRPYIICWFILVFVFPIHIGYTQNTSHQLTIDDNFWTLPTTECDGDNFCEVRVSPEGTIYGWDNINRKLYVSRLRQDTYEIYNLSSFSNYLGYGTDFVPYDSLGVVMFFSSFGGYDSYLTQYTLSTDNLQELEFPNGYKPISCNIYSGVLQRTFRFIYQLGMNGKLVACSKSPENRPVIHIINVSTKTIEKTLDVVGWLDDTGRPQWRLAGGLDNKIYLMKRNPQDTILNLPEIDPLTQEIVLIYDVSSDGWSYKIIPFSASNIILNVLPDSTVFIDKSNLIEYSADFEVLRQIDKGVIGPYNGIYQGMTLDGYVFFYMGGNYSDIRVVNINDFPLLVTLTPTYTPTPTNTSTNTPTNTPKRTPSPTATNTAVGGATATRTPKPTKTATPTRTPSPTATSTITPFTGTNPTGTAGTPLTVTFTVVNG